KSGIVSTGVNAGPFPPSTFTVNNTWAGPFAGVWYIVYAGKELNPLTGQLSGGGVRIYSLPIDPNALDQTLQLVGDFPASTKAGLTIVGVTGHAIQFSTGNGGTVSFDLGTNS